MNPDPNRTVRELATEIPGATRIFEKFGIDYCCGGGKSLSEACAGARIPLQEVLQALAPGGSFMPANETSLPNFATRTLEELVEHIITTHHAYVKQELPRLRQLLNKVVGVHGVLHPELGSIRQVFEGMSAELSAHMLKEEQILFPWIVALEEATTRGKSVPAPPFGSVGNPIHMMELEHDSAGAALREISALSSGYTPPEGACFSYRTLFSALKEFESDLHQHVHLENNILFPRSLALESQAVTA